MKKTSLPKNNSESGIILFTVLMMTIVLSLVVVGFLGSSIGQVKSSQDAIDEVKTEQLALKYFFKYQEVKRAMNGMGVASISDTVTLDQKTYISSATLIATNGLNNTNTIRMDIIYQ